MSIKDFVFILLLSLSINSWGQDISVEKFYLDETDLEALNNQHYDQNGEPYSLIKIQTTEHGFSFDTGLSFNEVEYKIAEIWLYVEAGAKRLTIRHPKLGTLRDYGFGESLRSTKTYVMKLTTKKVVTTAPDCTKTKILRFNVNPKNAKIKLNGAPYHSDDPSYCFGTYIYTISADRYNSVEGEIEVTGRKDEEQIIVVNLKPKFGWIRLSNVFSDRDTKLFVDNQEVNSYTNNLVEINSGKHSIRVVKPLHRMYEETITMSDSMIIYLDPMLIEDYGMITLEVANNAEIWVDGYKKGVGSWSGKIESGRHKVVCKKENHKNTEKTVNITKDTKGKIILDTPSPIKGHCSISTSPSGATVYIDGEKIGVSPCLYETIIGSHWVKVEKENYKDESRSVHVSKDNIENVYFTMTDINNVNIKTNLPSYIGCNTSIKGNGVDYSYMLNKVTTRLQTGDYTVIFKPTRLYRSKKVQIHVDKNHTYFNFRLRKDLIKGNEFYFEPAIYSRNMMNAVGMTMGGYINHFNMEIGGFYSLTESEQIYWSGKGHFPFTHTYQPFIVDARFGGGIHIGGRLKLTPQLGVSYLRLIEKKNDTNGIADGAWSIGAVGSLRFSFALSNHLGLFLTPEYSQAIKSSDGYELLASVSDKIDDWRQGLGFKTGLHISLYR